VFAGWMLVLDIRRRVSKIVEQLDIYVVTRHVNDESPDREHRRKREDRAGDHIENRTMPGTRDPAAVECALIERRTIMRADIFDRV
jgi:hypothetical protein